MRQLKNFMKAKKPMWNCGECKCITLQCWRENDEFCNCGTSSEGLGVEYKFKNWDGRILKQWSIEEWATPTPPADPTREATAEYTYTFAGWDPEVGPISEDTIYTAQFEATPRNYTVTIGVSPEWAGTVGTSQVTVPYDSPIGYNENELYVADYTIVATAGSWYTFSGWGTIPIRITEDTNVTATFIVTPIPVTELDDWFTDGIDVIEWWTTTATMSYLPANANDFSALTIAPDEESSYSWEATWVLTSYENWVATVTITWTAVWEYNLRATVENGGTSTSHMFHGYTIESNL